MNKKYDAIDWQSFSQKKDIEEIAKNTREKNVIQVAATVEIAMAVLSLLADGVFKDKIPLIFVIVVGGTSVVVLGYLAAMILIKCYNKHKPGHDIPDWREMVDLFDNDICYYVLMAESYSDKIAQINGLSPSNVEQFYFMETCFYINKAIHNLVSTTGCMEKLYSVDKMTVYQKKNISYTRLKNIFNILDDCIEKVDSFQNVICGIDIKNNYIELCERYKEDYKSFKKIFYDIDPELKKEQ